MRMREERRGKKRKAEKIKRLEYERGARKREQRGTERGRRKEDKRCEEIQSINK